MYRLHGDCIPIFPANHQQVWVLAFAHLVALRNASPSGEYFLLSIIQTESLKPLRFRA